MALCMIIDTICLVHTVTTNETINKFEAYFENPNLSIHKAT